MKPTQPRQPRVHAPDPYAALPDLYDLEHAEYGEDIPLYLNFAEVVGDPILDLGCGTGRITVPLAKAGWRVTGLDRSSAMLDVARSRIAAESSIANVEFIEADYGEPDLGRSAYYGLVIIGLNGLMHLPTLDAQRTCLSAAHGALDPRGQLIIDVINPTPETLQSLDRGVVHEGGWTMPDGRQVDKFSARKVSSTAQTIDTQLWYDIVEPDGVVRRATSSFTLRYVHKAELALMLESAGFIECQFYGSYELDPLDDSSERLIVTAELSPSPETDDIVLG